MKNLDLDSCTLSEILRLHILASGADITSANAKYRYQKRGGFDTTDDACMELRLSNPGLLKKLSSTSVYDLLPGNKRQYMLEVIRLLNKWSILRLLLTSNSQNLLYHKIIEFGKDLWGSYVDQHSSPYASVPTSTSPTTSEIAEPS